MSLAGLRVLIPLLQLDPSLPLPSYASEGDGGADLLAATSTVLAPRGGRAVLTTGVAIALPPGYVGCIQPRSGLAARHGVTCLNAPGLIDAGYRGELKVVLVNTDPTDAYEVCRGDRIAQLVIYPFAQATFVPAAELDPTERGTDGFGHSGR